MAPWRWCIFAVEKAEADMKTLTHHKINTRQALPPLPPLPKVPPLPLPLPLPRDGRFPIVRFLQSVMKALGSLFRPGSDPIHLNRHLRRDAGVDELELERRRVLRAPLIR